MYAERAQQLDNIRGGAARTTQCIHVLDTNYKLAALTLYGKICDDST